MSKAVKVSLDKSHRPEIEKLSQKTGLTFQQIVNHVWSNSGTVKANLESLFDNKSLTGKASK